MARRRVDGLDVAGVVVAVAAVVWTLVTGRHDLAGAAPIAALQAGTATVYLVARVAGGRSPAVVPVLVVGGAAATLVLTNVLPAAGALSPPLGYANANAAFYVLVAVAAAMAGAAFPKGPATAVAVPLAVAFALAAVVSGSVTGVVVLCLGAGALLARLAGSPRQLVAGAAVAVQVVVAATALLGVARLDGDRVPAIERAVDERRVLLWRDAAALAHRHPLVGVGPGRFEDQSPTAASDRDARWAHSGFLQQGAEQGALGLALVLGAFGWGFARLWSGPDDTTTLLGALALAALGLHAGVDYVLHVPAVPLVGAALVGAATGRRPPADRGGDPGAGPAGGSPG